MAGPVKLSASFLLLVQLLVRECAGFGFENTLNEGSPCYDTLEDGTDDLNKPLRCMPPFKNVISNAPVTVAPEEMTCGINQQSQFCLQTGGFYRECQICDAYDATKAHNTSYLTDIHTDQNQTSWQSVTMNENVHMTLVNLTVNLNKAYDITYVRLKFASPRPESFAIYKKFRNDPWTEDPDPDGGWIPWQFYSASCRDTYDVPDALSILRPTEEEEEMGYRRLGEDRALCTSDFSDISPLSGGNVAFATLDGRPGAFNFDHNQELQHWVSATDIRISLKNLNTFGDEVFGDPKVLQSYYYAITHFIVGGRCKCNGHSNVCIPSDPEDSGSRSICLCKHGTTGDNCETCLPDHWDRRWQRATSQNANPCLPCECNGWSTKCRFNEEQYMRTRRGGECMECEGNRDGPHCEICKPNHYISPVKDAYGRQPCLDCDCDPQGSTNLQCSVDGKCQCKPGVTGDKCDMCEANYWNFPDDSSQGCESCECMVEGSLGNRPSCNTESGQCDCKQNVEGQRCDRCKSGHFYIDLDNEFGCTPCFCYGHTAQCSMAPGYTKSVLASDFSRGTDDWGIVELGQPGMSAAQFNPFKKFISLKSVQQSAYFVAPERFIGDQRNSYNRELKFSLKIGLEDLGPQPTPEDLIIEGGGDKLTSISVPITAQNNPIPTKDMQEYIFKLHENPEFGWTPSLRPKDFIAVLSNITNIKIRGSYVPEGMGIIDEFILESAEYGGSGKPATSIEKCDCPQGYRGNFCEKCQLGFYHKDNGGAFARCIPCNCNGHSDYCNEESGVCDCSHNTGGDNCELCADGFYGDAVLGTPDDCKVCPCPTVREEDGTMRAGKCYEIEGHPESPICSECPTGRIGSRCELCEDGYFGDPEGLHGTRIECRRCECSRNIDPSAIGNCDRTTGECLRCIDDTAGWNCEKCKSGFFGDALAPRNIGDPKNCQPCQCNPFGTFHSDENMLPECNALTGKCSCKPNVVGHDCEKCKDGFWNLNSGNGCEDCHCDSVGSINATCHDATGQCFCREGIFGLRCDKLMPLYFAFSVEGAQPCDCDPSGSLSDQCDIQTGQCPCRDKVEGRRCDTCMENTKTRTGSENEKVCEPCDDCYNLVQDAANEHRDSLDQLDTLLRHISENPEPIGSEFEVPLRKLRVRIRNMLVDTKLSASSEDGGSLRDRLEDLYVKLRDVQDVVTRANTQLDDAQGKGREASENVARAEDVINRAKESLRGAKNLLDVDGRDSLRKAEEKARKFGKGNAQMTSLASTARKLAEEQFESASEIESIAKQANELSNEAYKTAHKALEEQGDTSSKISNLQDEVRDMGAKLSQVQSDSMETLKAASDSYLKALTIYQSVFNLQVPEVENPDKYSNDAAKIIEDAEMIKNDAESLITENEELLNEATRHRYELEQYLGQVRGQQQNIDSHLQDMETNRDAALKAVDTESEVLQKAQDTLDILKNFENKVNENRAAAESALDKISNIENTLRIAVEDTSNADAALLDTDADSVTAYEIAIASKTTAEEASQNAKIIDEESTTVLEKAEALNNDATSLRDKSDDTDARVKSKDSSSSRDAQTAADALREANKAQSSSLEATEKVNQAKNELEEIAQILATIDIQDPSFLDELERRLDAAERKYQEADLESKLKQLEEAKQRQIPKANFMRDEISIMEKEITTIEEITQTLPDFCPSSSDHCLEC